MHAYIHVYDDVTYVYDDVTYYWPAYISRPVPDMILGIDIDIDIRIVSEHVL